MLVIIYNQKGRHDSTHHWIRALVFIMAAGAQRKTIDNILKSVTYHTPIREK
jgi:hypothetical protein